MRAAVFILILLAGCGGSGGSNEPQDNDPPNAPADLRVIDTSGGVTLSWEGVGDTFNIYLSTDAAFEVENYSIYDDADLRLNASSPYTVNGLETGPVWHFSVTASNSGVESKESNRVSAVTRFQPTTDGSVILDVVTGLEWKRCAEGMIWEGDQCTGNVTLFGPGDAEQFDAPDSEGWRAPTFEQLDSLVFCPEEMDYFASPGQPPARCTSSDTHPAIYEPAFPDPFTERAYYTRTVRFGSAGEYRKTVEFERGFSTGVPLDAPYQIAMRLVRESQNQ